MKELFRKIAHASSEMMGTPTAFIVAVIIILVWVFAGSFYQYSTAWQLVVNSGTNILAFLMIFLLQNTQTRDSKIFQLKLDEIIRSIKNARNKMVDLEDLSDEELDKLEDEFRRLRERSTRVSSKDNE